MKRLLVAAVLLAAGFGAGLLYDTLRRPPLVLHQDAVVEGVSRDEVVVAYRQEAGGFIDVRPALQASHTLFVFYPGGFVRPQAYEWLGVALAPLGVRTLIPRFPFDLGVIAPNRAEALIAELREGGEDVGRLVVGGHSLGGAMAARFAYRHPQALDALVLMAAYSAEGDDLSGLELPVLVLAAEHDGLAELETVRSSLSRLPPHAELHVLSGAVHSFFGRYGPQRGDGLPTVSRHEAEGEIIAALESFLRDEMVKR